MCKCTSGNIIVEFIIIIILLFNFLVIIICARMSGQKEFTSQQMKLFNIHHETGTLDGHSTCVKTKILLCAQILNTIHNNTYLRIKMNLYCIKISYSFMFSTTFPHISQWMMIHTSVAPQNEYFCLGLQWLSFLLQWVKNPISVTKYGMMLFYWNHNST